MPVIQDILQFHFSPTAFQKSAEKIIPLTLISLIDHRIDKLQKITDLLGENPDPKPSDILISQVFKKFKKSIIDKNTSFELRELKTLTYALNYSEQKLTAIFSNENELKHSLTLLESNWRDRFLFGLIDFFLRNWETKYQKSSEYLEKFINQKLNDYSGSRRTLTSFKNNKQFFNTKNGDLIFGDHIAKLNKPIQDATKILGVPESWFGYSYFSKVIITYYDRNKSKIADEINYLSEVLFKHNSSITSKRLISKIIIQANKPEYSTLQDSVKKIAFSQIGDPSTVSSWSAFDNATESERRELIEARNILNEWITKQFINVFFNVCINDERRKKFWLRFASKISSFKVYGPLRTKNLLKRDERIAEYVDARFETFIGKRDISAFILYVENYMLIEFSNEGYAAIAYKPTSQFKPNLNYQLNSADDLRNSSMPMAIESGTYSDQYNEEGRLFHKDGKTIWETKFNNWMTQKVFR